ncbi:hypothetical protein VQ03_04935 [Methylobacterium tarhaniae]|uniref:Uncharacterized protein n=2 Tax=Methylobacterium tarhaniae TaxID=1187852 RepID=A0A0J6TEL8_9HYPH|nr:hypothetical protein VQ03_04935 [Methylobacterium tarhaniae]
MPEDSLDETARAMEAIRLLVADDMPVDAWLQETLALDDDDAAGTAVRFPGPPVAEIIGRGDIGPTTSRSGVAIRGCREVG